MQPGQQKKKRASFERRILLFGFAIAGINCLIGMAIRFGFRGDASLGW
jgi:hypothetical protein